METRVAVIGIIVENKDSVQELNAILHEYGEYIIGRMGVPYRARHQRDQRRRGRAADGDQRPFGQDRQPCGRERQDRLFQTRKRIAAQPLNSRSAQR